MAETKIQNSFVQKVLPILVILAAYVSIQMFAISGPFFPLDDQQELARVNGVDSWWQLLGTDTFHLFRPVKNLFFALFSVFHADNAYICRVIAIIVGGLSYFPVLALFRRVHNSEASALLSSAVWLLAPTLVSSVAWLSCVNIQAMCGLGALAIVLHDKSFDGGSIDLRCVLGCSICVFLSCVSYECAVAVCPLIVVFDFFLRHRRFASLKTFRLYVLYAGLTLVYLVIRWIIGSTSSLDGNFINATKFDMVAASAYFVFWHFFVWLWPFGKMTPLGSYSPGDVSLFLIVGCWLALVATIVVVFALRRRRPLVAFGIAFAVVAFLPVSNLLGLGNGPYGDYYMGLPSIGLSVLVVVLCRALFSVVGKLRIVCFVFGAVVVISRAFAVPEAARWAWLWADGERAFLSGISAFPHVYGNYLMLARVFFETGRIEDSMRCCDWLETRLGAYSDKMSFVYKVRALEAMNIRRDAKDAMRNLDMAMRVEKGSGYQNVRFYRGCVYEDLLSDEKSAEIEYREAVKGEWTVDTPAAADRLARLLAIRGELDEAEALWEKALKYNPGDSTIRHNLQMLRQQKESRDSGSRSR